MNQICRTSVCHFVHRKMSNAKRKYSLPCSPAPWKGSQFLAYKSPSFIHPSIHPFIHACMHAFIHYSLKDHSPTPSLSVSDLVLFYSLIHSCIHSFPCPFTLTPPHSVLPSFTYSPPAITIVATWICTLQIRKTLTVLVTTLQTAMKDWKDCDTIATFCSKSSLVLPLTDRTLASMSSKQCTRDMLQKITRKETGAACPPAGIKHLRRAS